MLMTSVSPAVRVLAFATWPLIETVPPKEQLPVSLTRTPAGKPAAENDPVASRTAWVMSCRLLGAADGSTCTAIGSPPMLLVVEVFCAVSSALAETGFAFDSEMTTACGPGATELELPDPPPPPPPPQAASKSVQASASVLELKIIDVPSACVSVVVLLRANQAERS
jgi:hypothetical protein